MLAHPKIAIVGALHGEEVYGIDLYNAFVSKYPHLAEKIALVIGNKRAVAEQKRFIDTDINRAYNRSLSGHESIEISRLSSELSDINADIIIDVHTTRRDSGIFFITDNLNPVKQKICDLLDIDICVMRDSIVASSFVGNNNKAVSLEYSLNSISEQTTDTFVERIRELIETGELNVAEFTRKIYEVRRLISRAEYKAYSGLKNADLKPEGIALMVPKEVTEMDAEYFGFWCQLIKSRTN